jgi:hypothetical protein
MSEEQKSRKSVPMIILMKRRKVEEKEEKMLRIRSKSSIPRYTRSP